LEQKLIIGSRGSDLALWQANYLKDQLSAQGVECEISVIKTKGDAIQNVSFDKIEGKGFFTKEIEQALKDGDIDIAVHSYKDLPTEPERGLIIAAVSYREDPADILIYLKNAKDVKQKWGLKQGAVVGTSSSRRRAQLLFHRPDLEVVAVRGNVLTRLEKIGTQGIDAVVLAAAGINRLALKTDKLITQRLSPTEFVPAPAQGALAFQCRDSDQEVLTLLQKINDKKTSPCIELERSILHKVEGGCSTPIGIYCQKELDHFLLSFYKEEDEKSQHLSFKHTDPSAIEKQIVPLIREEKRVRVFITRELGDESVFKKALESRGHRVSGESLITFKKIPFSKIPKSEWIFFSSRKAVRFFFNQLKKKPSADLKFACLGQGTASEYKKHMKNGLDFIGKGSRIKEIAEAFLEQAEKSKVLFPMAENSLRSVQKYLEGKKIDTVDLPVYKSTMKARFSDPAADVLVFTSPLNAKSYYERVPKDNDQRIVAIGKSTAMQLELLGLKKVRVAFKPDELSLASLCY